MKVAILTQPLGTNYGGILQAYALQKILKDLGHDVTTIDRQSNHQSFIKKLLLPYKSTIYKILGRKLDRTLNSEQKAYVYSGMTDFIEKKMKTSMPVNNSAEMKAHYKKNNYDLFVVGSDQVWRPKYSPNIYNYFVDFVGSDTKNITYAASFGVDEWEFNEEQTLHCKKLVQKFKAISVRESSAIVLCKENLGVNAELVLDPTLLVSADDYCKLLLNHKSTGQGKLLKYILDNNVHKSKIIDEVSNSLGKEIFMSQPIRNLTDTNYENLEDYKYPTVEEWIMSFRDADFIVTDSFHGCVFSIIFNKPFIAIGNQERGLSRFDSLLGIFGLKDRLIFDNEKKLQSLIEKEIDWESVNAKLVAYQKSSFSFLKSSLGD